MQSSTTDTPGTAEGGGRHVRQVVSVRPLTDDTFVIAIDRGAFACEAGQHVTLGVSGSGVNREYSIYSPSNADEIEFIAKIRAGSFVSAALREAEAGALVDLAGPYGAFVIERPDDASRRYLFIASGVGIAPFHSFAVTYPQLDYLLLHGIRRTCEQYDRAAYAPGRYLSCVSGEDGGDFRGRVTAYLQAHPAETDRYCYICGNNAMVSEVYDLLRVQGVPSDQLFTEVFF